MTWVDLTLVDTAINNKDVFTTLIILFVFLFVILIILLPIIRWNNKRYDRLITAFEKHTEKDWEELSKIYNELKSHNENSERQFAFLRNNLNNTTLTNEQAVRLLKREMWLTSRKKLNFIKDILLNNHINWREHFISEKVKIWLAWYSQEYLTNFKWYTTWIWDLWKWLDDNFSEKEFIDFVKEIVDVMFRPDKWEKTSVIQNKMSEISLIMETLQNALWLKLKNDLISK